LRHGLKRIVMGDKECRDLEKCFKRTPNKKDSKNSAQNNNASFRKRLDYNASADLVHGDRDCQEMAAATATLAKTTLGLEHPSAPSLPQYDDVYHSISQVNGMINRMDLSTMKKRCAELNLHPMGKREAVKRRLKEYYKETMLIEAGLIDPRENRNVDVFVVIDFEATCEERNPADYKHEIIEFPAVLVSSASGEIVDIFHEYCRPVINPVLSEFCRALTGIEQSTVDSADVFQKVHQRFINWMFNKHELGLTKTYSIVTDGPFDMGRFLFLQCTHLGMEFPHYGNCWVNIRKSFANYYKGDFYAKSQTTSTKLPGLNAMLTLVGLEFEGQPHSGLDDAKNIARVLLRLIADRAFVRVNEKIIIKGSTCECGEADSPKLRSVAAVPRRESEQWFKKQKELVKRNQCQKKR